MRATIYNPNGQRPVSIESLTGMSINAHNNLSLASKILSVPWEWTDVLSNTPNHAVFFSKGSAVSPPETNTALAKHLRRLSASGTLSWQRGGEQYESVLVIEF